MKLTVLVTVFNEAKTVLKAVEEAKKIESEKEIIVIDNCSTDGSRELLKTIDDKAIQIIYQDRNYGYGKSIERGFALAKGEYIYVHMSDLEYHYANCFKMLRVMEVNNYDTIFGTRFKKNESIFKIIKQRRENIASLICTFLINKWYHRNFHDVLGARLYRKESIMRIPISTYGIGFEFEHTSRMCKYGLRIGEVEIQYSPRLIRAEKKIKPYHIFIALWTLFRVRYCDFLSKGFMQ